MNARLPRAIRDELWREGQDWRDSVDSAFWYETHCPNCSAPKTEDNTTSDDAVFCETCEAIPDDGEDTEDS